MGYANLPNDKKSRQDALIGVEYSGINDTALTLEFSTRHILGYDSVLEHGPDRIYQDKKQITGQIERTFLNETLTFTAFHSLTIDSENGGSVSRVSCRFEVIDDLTVEVVTVLYDCRGDGAFSPIKDNDKILTTVKYSF
ncbi:hypothetical protein [Desulfoluna sp.]|uniref:hypothetical protein n=1 Tax=Desulfoluna sp. TaxID=2045199 RepID=UPI002635216C|nr:hypothetical protein [Desulfoluna sp.]